MDSILMSTECVHGWCFFTGSYDQLLRPPLPGSQGETGRDSGETHCHIILTRSGWWSRWWWYEIDHHGLLFIVQLWVFLSILRLLLSKTKSFVEPTPEEETYSWVPVKIERWSGKQSTWSIFWSIWSYKIKHWKHLDISPRSEYMTHPRWVSNWSRRLKHR